MSCVFSVQHFQARGIVTGESNDVSVSSAEVGATCITQTVVESNIK